MAYDCNNGWGAIQVAVAAVKAAAAVAAVAAIKAFTAVRGPNWELQFPIRSSNIYMRKFGRIYL